MYEKYRLKLVLYKHFTPCCLCILDLRSGVSARFRRSVASAAGSDHPACHTAEHHAALLP